MSLGGKTTPSGGLVTSSGRFGVDAPVPLVATEAIFTAGSLRIAKDCDGALLWLFGGVSGLEHEVLGM